MRNERKKRAATVLCLAFLPALAWAWITGALPSGTTAREQAREMLSAVEVQAGPSSSLPVALSIDEPMASASAALQRADLLRNAGDEAHAELADDLALEWAQIARETVRVAMMRQETASLQARSLAMSASASSLHSQLEEAVGRREKLHSVFEELERQQARKAMSSTSSSTETLEPKAGPVPAASSGSVP